MGLACSSGGKILKTVEITLNLSQGYYVLTPEHYREDFLNITKCFQSIYTHF